MEKYTVVPQDVGTRCVSKPGCRPAALAALLLLLNQSFKDVHTTTFDNVHVLAG